MVGAKNFPLKLLSVDFYNDCHIGSDIVSKKDTFDTSITSFLFGNNRNICRFLYIFCVSPLFPVYKTFSVPFNANHGCFGMENQFKPPKRIS